LAFGKWGTYKRLELMIDAFPGVGKEITKRQIGNRLEAIHRSLPVCGNAVKKKVGTTIPTNRIYGYLEEERLPDLFQSSFSSCNALFFVPRDVSGVAHLASPMEVRSFAPICRFSREWRMVKILQSSSISPGRRKTWQLACLIPDESRKAGSDAMQNFSSGFAPWTMP